LALIGAAVCARSFGSLFVFLSVFMISVWIEKLIAKAMCEVLIAAEEVGAVDCGSEFCDAARGHLIKI